MMKHYPSTFIPKDPCQIVFFEEFGENWLLQKIENIIRDGQY